MLCDYGSHRCTQAIRQGSQLRVVLQAREVQLQEALKAQEAALQQWQQEEVNRLDAEKIEIQRHAQRKEHEHSQAVHVMQQRQAEVARELQQAKNELDVIRAQQVQHATQKLFVFLCKSRHA